MSWLHKILGADGSSVAKVDGNTGSVIGALRTTNNPLDYGTGGHYRYAAVTGTLPAALAANAVVFSFRWGSPTFYAVPLYLRASFQTLTAFTAGTITDFGFDAFVGRTFTASHTGGTAATMTNNNGKARTSMSTSQLPTNGDMRIATTAAFAGAAGITIDSHAFANSIGKANIVNAAAGTEYAISRAIELDYTAEMANGHHPILLAQNEGVIIRNRVVWPAAGTGVLRVQFGWAEVPTTILS